MTEKRVFNADCDYIHQYFELSYASYLVLPRSVLQSMPVKWQKDFVNLLNILQNKCELAGIETPAYNVIARENGKITKDKYRDYRRGRRDVFEEIGKANGLM